MVMYSGVYILYICVCARARARGRLDISDYISVSTGTVLLARIPSLKSSHLALVSTTLALCLLSRLSSSPRDIVIHYSILRYHESSLGTMFSLYAVLRARTTTHARCTPQEALGERVDDAHGAEESFGEGHDGARSVKRDDREGTRVRFNVQRLNIT